MTKEKSAATKKQYRVLVPCRNNDTDKDYEPGDIVTSDDFSQETINNWLIIEPPALEVV